MASSSTIKQTSLAEALDIQRELPRPKKRRRHGSTSSALNESDSEILDLPSYPSAILETDREVNEEDRDGRVRKTKAQERQDRIHVPRNAESYENVFVTQLTQPQSSPSRIRGPRWKKKSPFLNGTDLRDESPHCSTKQNITMRNGSIHSQSSVCNSPSMRQNRVYTEHANEVPTDLEDAFDTSSISGDDVQPSDPPPAREPSKTLRQSTLFGSFSRHHEPSANAAHLGGQKWPSVAKNEPPTHHKLEASSLETWIYPTNLGCIRDYQFNIVHRGLFHNLLVALPTGLGKTFIAATVMLNWFRWTTDAQIIFVAPTKPLVAQQVDACFSIAGIPRSSTIMLTGNVQPALRAEEWQSKRVFFMTPQTLVRDLKSGICDPKKLVLLVVDEAHRATGNYAYVEIVRFLRRFNTSFRVLGLTATPGSSVEAVQNVIDGLDISRVEIRTENSLDIRQFVHNRSIDLEVFDRTDEMAMVMDLFSKALQPILNRLNTQNAYWGKDPTQLTAYGLTKARQQWNSSDAGRRAYGATKAITNRIFTLLAGLAHTIELLKFYSIGSFYHKIVAFTREDNGKYAKEIKDHADFKTLMDRLRIWMNKDDFLGHPKLSYLKEVVLNHFLDAGEGRGAADGRPPSDTRIMVFVHYRDCAEEIVRVLKQHEPMIRPHVFVGQAAAKGSDGMDQKTQLGIVENFKKGRYNTIVATSIGEEGLDIGEVDLIVCYDSSSSPIRMLQRMGRTGRKRSGNIVLLLMREKEEDSYLKARDNYEKIQQKIANGSEFQFHDDRSPRIIPKDVQPVVDKRVIDIPAENSQSDLPEPKRRARISKKPQKKFHMPDGVETGFIQASLLGATDVGGHQNPKITNTTRKTETASLPPLETVLLSPDDILRLEQRYCAIHGSDLEYIHAPRIGASARLQRTFRPTHWVGHGRATGRLVSALRQTKNMVHNGSGRRDKMFSANGKTLSGISDFFEGQTPEAASFLTRYPSHLTGRPPKEPLDLGGRPDLGSEELVANGDQFKGLLQVSQQSTLGSESEWLPDIGILFNDEGNSLGVRKSDDVELRRPSRLRRKTLILHEDEDDSD